MLSLRIKFNSYHRIQSCYKFHKNNLKFSCRPTDWFQSSQFSCIHNGNNAQRLSSAPVQASAINILSIQVPSCALFSSESTEEVDAVTYESVCEETLDSLCEFFEDVVEKYSELKTADVCFGDGVLTVNLDKFGTYVINRQSPNKQIWLSSPTSGPKRYDFVPSRNGWVYRHNNKTLHSLLQEELSKITKSTLDFSACAYCGDFK